jgi:hypothetical protein
VIALGAVLTGLLVGVVIAGTGGDGGSKSTDSAPPDLTVPGGSAGTPTDTKTTKKRSETGTTGDSGSAGTDQSGGAAAPPSAPDTGGAAPAQPQDTPQNDTQPPSGSPAQRFEQFCEQNPSAC